MKPFVNIYGKLVFLMLAGVKGHRFIAFAIPSVFTRCGIGFLKAEVLMLSIHISALIWGILIQEAPNTTPD
jgi:hypothetical protein